MKKIKRFKFGALLMVAIFIMTGALSVLLTACGDPTAPITFAKSEISMYVSDSARLEYSLLDENAEVTWASSDETVVAVRRGTVTAKKVGEATITASVEGGGSAICKITVLDRTVTISQTTATIDLDGASRSVTLTAAASDGGAVSWETSDSSIATVADGVVTATGELGEVTITAARGAAKATCVVSVIQPSRPADYYKVTKLTNADTIADPGVWHYHADGSENSDYSFTAAPIHQNNSVSVTLGNFNFAAGRYFYFRYQPEYALDAQYTITFKAKMTADGQIRYTDGTSTKMKALTANTVTDITYVGKVNASQPFSVRIDSCEALANATPTTLELTEITVQEGDHGGGETDVPHRSDLADLAQYTLQMSTNASIVLDRGAWYYSADGEPGKDYTFAEAPKYDNGTVTMAFANIEGQKPVYQLRYQPDYAVNTYYKLTCKVNLSAPGTITYGTKVSDEEVYYTPYEFTEAGDYLLEFIGFVNGACPFSIGVKPVDWASPIAVTVSDLVVEETEAPAPPETAVDYALAKKNKGETIAAPGVWAYMADGNEGENYSFVSAPAAYTDGTVVLDMATMDTANDKPTYQLRYQPDLAVGTEYTATFKVTFVGNGYFLYGNDGKNSKDLPETAKIDENTWNVSWTGTVSASDPFFVQIKSEDGYATPVKLVVGDFAVKTAAPVDPTADYDLAKRTNAEVREHAGEWAYFADGAAFTVETAKYENGKVTFAMAAMTDNSTYQLRYQPDLAKDTQYTISFKITFTGNGYFLYGNNYKSSKDLPADAKEGENTWNVTWTGAVSDNPFMIQIKSNDGYATPVAMVVENIVITPAEA